MSQSNIPNITPRITVTRDDAINLLLASIALEELGLSHIINAEGEKIQYVLGTLPGVSAPNATISDILLVNKSVRDTIRDLSKQEFLLMSKLDSILSFVGTYEGGITGATGVTGATGATGGTGAATQLRGIQVQLQDSDSLTVDSGAAVIFDTVVNDQSSFLSYSAVTGEITITETGVFYVSWWVSTDGIIAGTNDVITFSIRTSAGDDVRASSPIVTNQMSGNALLDITASPGFPVTLQLVNVTNGTVGFGATPIKADLIMMNVAL